LRGPALPRPMTPEPRGSGPATAGDGAEAFERIRREHTELQMLASRFHEVAAQVERGEPVTKADLAEGVEVHRRFLVELHHRREALIADALGATAGSAVAAAFARCRAEHPKAVEFESAAQALLSAPGFGSAQLHRVAALFEREATRIVEHTKDEDDAIHRVVVDAVPPNVRAAFVEKTRALDSEAAAAEERLLAWSSRSNASSD